MFSKTLKLTIRPMTFTPRRKKTAQFNPSYELYKLDQGPPTPCEMTDEEATDLMRRMLLIRRTESKAADLYRAKLINGFCHLYNGQEAVAVGVHAAMQEPDTIITSYRCHAFASMFGSTPRMVFAELMGRQTGTSKGKGGSMHMYGPKFFGGDGIVGGQVPIGTGIGLAHKYNSTGGVNITLYGDGAASQGQVHESWNMCKLWNLPCIYICENNKFGMGTATHRHSANPKFYTRGDLIPGIQVNGMKVEDVREAIKFSREYAVKNGPIILECQTYRYFGHSMSDPGTAYRTREEVKEVQEKEDPIKQFTDMVLEKGLMTQEQIDGMKKEIFQVVDAQLEEAKNDPWTDISELGTDVYVKKLETIRGMVPWAKV